MLLFFKQDQDKEFHRFVLPNTARDMDLHRDGIQIVAAHFDNHVHICKMVAKAG